MKHFSIAGALLGALLLASGPAAAGKLYKWVDENGKVHYGDKIPPKYAKQEKHILNERGIEVDRIEAAKTPEQIEEERRLEEKRKEEERRRAEQAAHDRMLLATFTSEDDMIMTRNGKLAAIDASIRVTRERITKLEQNLVNLSREAANMERAGKPVPDKLQEEIVAARAQIQRYRDYIAAKRREQQQIRDQFERDIKRFRELKSIKPKAR